MNFRILEVEQSSVFDRCEIGKTKNELCLVTPSDQLLQQLPFSKHLDIKPVTVSRDSFLQEIIEFNVHPSDVFVCSLPKCGSSWMQTIVWLLTNGLNYEAAKTLDRLQQLGDFDEYTKLDAARSKAQELFENDVSKPFDQNDALKIAWNEVFKTMDTPRVFKTHSHIFFLPKAIWSTGAKIIYVVRNPKDMVVSTYHYVRNFMQWNVTMTDCVDGIIANRLFGSPFLSHILNFWRVRHLPNVLFVAYEDLVNDAFCNVKKISEFLDCKYTDEQLKELTEYISFDKMKKNKAINREQEVFQMESILKKKRPDADFAFLRKGKVGGYCDDLNDEQIQKIDEWVRNGLKDTDFTFRI